MSDRIKVLCSRCDGHGTKFVGETDHRETCGLCGGRGWINVTAQQARQTEDVPLRDLIHEDVATLSDAEIARLLEAVLERRERFVQDVDDIQIEKRPLFIVAGWGDAKHFDVFSSLQECVETFPEVFGGPLTLDEARRAVELVNSEGNYNEFIFRPAWPDEILAASQRKDTA